MPHDLTITEVKSNDDGLSPALKYYQGQLSAPLAFQVVLESDFVKADCFAAKHRPLVVPARTLLLRMLQLCTSRQKANGLVSISTCTATASISTTKASETSPMNLPSPATGSPRGVAMLSGKKHARKACTNHNPRR